MAVAGSRGSPVLKNWSTSPFAVSTTSWSLLSGTRMRVPAMQDCPLLRNPAFSAMGRAWFKSASSRMMVGDLPPSSRVTRLSVPAASRRMVLPTTVEPVNDIFMISGWRLSSVPTTSPRPVTILNTPLGRPASCNASVSTCICVALISLGLRTAVHPAARAAASFPQMNTASLFHGVNQARDADRLHHHRGTASPPREFELLERVRRFLKRGRGHVRHPTAPRHGCAIFFGDRIEQRLPLCGHGVAEPLKGGDNLVFRGSGPAGKGALRRRDGGSRIHFVRQPDMADDLSRAGIVKVKP